MMQGKDLGKLRVSCGRPAARILGTMHSITLGSRTSRQTFGGESTLRSSVEASNGG